MLNKIYAAIWRHEATLIWMIIVWDMPLLTNGKINTLAATGPYCSKHATIDSERIMIGHERME